jgi:hypothetical protein
MTRISVQAILAGGLTGLLVTNLLAIPFVAFVVMNAGLTRLPKDQMQVALAATIPANGALHAMQILLGLIATGIGGYAAAWIAKHNQVLNGALASWTCIAVGLSTILSRENSMPLLINVGLMLASIACAAFGGYLRHPPEATTRVPV